MKKNSKTLRTLTALAVIVIVFVGFLTNLGIGTTSAPGIWDISILCPLGALGTMLASKMMVPRALVSLVIMVVLIVIFARAFCGWMCPVPLVQKLRGVQVGRLAVGSSYVKFFPWLTRIVSGFHEKYPGITVELCSGTSTELAARMSAKALDFAIISRREGDFSSTVLKRDGLVAMLPPEHPMAHSDGVPATIFETEPYIEIHTGLQTDTLSFLYICADFYDQLCVFS